MRLQIRLFKLIVSVLSTIGILGLNLILLKSSGDLISYVKTADPTSFFFYLAKHILNVFGGTIVEVAFVWLLVILNPLSIRSGLIITLVMLILSGIYILVPISNI